MYRFFDKHGKKVLAVAASLLMVAFLLPTTAQNGCFRSNQQHGKIAGEDVTPAEIAAAAAHLQATQTVILGGSFQRSVASQLLDPSLFDQRTSRALLKDSLTFYLLLREAREAGIQPNTALADMIIEKGKLGVVRDPENPENLMAFNKINPAVQEQLRNSMAQVAMVRDYFIRSLQTVKISEPLVDQRLVKDNQQVRARVLVLNAKDFQDKVSPPTPEQLEQQFNAFRRETAGVKTSSNPFGFGYLVPDKARFQYIAVPDDQLLQAVVAEREEKQWDEDARVYYLKNQARYAPPKPKAELDPKAGPTTAPTSQPAVLPYEEVRDRVYHDLREPLVENLRNKIVNRIAQQLTKDYQRATTGSTTPTTEQVAGFKIGDLTLGSTEYLLHIRDEISKQFKVTITVVNDSNLISAEELHKRPGVGMASLKERGPRGEHSIEAATYLFESIKLLVPQDKRAERPTLELFQPAKALQGGGATYIIRAVAAESAKPTEKLEDVKERVEKDVWRKLAFQLAVDAAQATLKQAESTSLAKVNGAHETEWFGAFASPIPGLPDDIKSFSGELTTPIFEMQRGLSSRNALPVRKVIRLEASDRVAVAELFDMQTTLTPDELIEKRAEARDMLVGEYGQPAMSDWFSAEAVAKRVGYVAPATVNAPPKVPDAPRAPVVPGM